MSAIMLILLVARRHDFVLPGDAQTRFLIAKRTALAVVAIAAYGIAAVWLNRLAADQPFTLAFAGRETLRGLFGLQIKGSPHLAGDFGQWFPLSLLLSGLGATGWIVSGWLAPWRHRVQQEARDRRRAHALVRRFGVDTLAPFSLRRDKSYFFAEPGSAFLSYRVVGGVAIVSGDPIGEAAACEALVPRFVEYAHERDWRIAILGASGPLPELYPLHGLQTLYHGDPGGGRYVGFSLEGRAMEGTPIGSLAEQVASPHGWFRRARSMPRQRRARADGADWRGDQPERALRCRPTALLWETPGCVQIGSTPRRCATWYSAFAAISAHCRRCPGSAK